MSCEYEIRPHHTFKDWVLVFKNGTGLRAFTTRLEAEQFVTRHKRLESLKEREVRL
jgi:hypothetical protein